jgi:outer membrane lipoprotein-sorting protein
MTQNVTKILAALTLCLAIAAPAQDRLQTVLHQMDEASAKFKSAQADLTQDLYERVVKETTTETGSIYFERHGATTEMGLRINPPNTRFIEYKNGVARIFDPGANHITEIRAGANQGQYESYLTLGFGGRGSDLAKSWDITDQGTEQINDGTANVPVEKLDLVSKDPAVRNNFLHITIWIDPTRSLSLRQQFFLPGGDYRLANFTHIRYNQKIDTAPYAIKPGKNPSIDRR